MPIWERGAIAGGVVAAALLVANVVDRVLTRRGLPPELVTRYRVLRRGVEVAIVVVGILSALLVIPEVRAIAGGILASSAVLTLIVGFAAQRTLGNVIAGVLIALSQPLRLGDAVEVDGRHGVVEEIGLTYTFIRADDGARIVIPNEKLASDTIRNETIRSSGRLATVTVQVPLGADLRALVAQLGIEAGDRGQVLVTDLAGTASLTVSAWAPDEHAAEQLESELRLRVHDRLRAQGVFAA